MYIFAVGYYVDGGGFNFEHLKSRLVTVQSVRLLLANNNLEKTSPETTLARVAWSGG